MQNKDNEAQYTYMYVNAEILFNYNMFPFKNSHNDGMPLSNCYQ